MTCFQRWLACADYVVNGHGVVRGDEAHCSTYGGGDGVIDDFDAAGDSGDYALWKERAYPQMDAR